MGSGFDMKASDIKPEAKKKHLHRQKPETSFPPLEPGHSPKDGLSWDLFVRVRASARSGRALHVELEALGLGSQIRHVDLAFWRRDRRCRYASGWSPCSYLTAVCTPAN